MYCDWCGEASDERVTVYGLTHGRDKLCPACRDNIEAQGEQDPEPYPDYGDEDGYPLPEPEKPWD